MVHILMVSNKNSATKIIYHEWSKNETVKSHHTSETGIKKRSVHRMIEIRPGASFRVYACLSKHQKCKH
ncbi:MAG: hypothetical protein BI182_02020 [Acetobacterium sp. MES1]|nr:MAG: hypothetical protein BI182_02020 [Acetobacterium sp. MES1]